MDNKIMILKGNIIYTKHYDKFTTLEHSYIVVKDNKILGIYKNLPKEYKNIKVIDYGEKLIIPGLVDLHLHASQYSLCGLGYDKTLLDWLNTYTFKEESKFKDIEYAKKVYKSFVNDIYKCGTTRSVIFATLHVKATEMLMDILKEKGLSAFVGKVNMDRNSPEYLIETTDESIESTKLWLKEYGDKYKNVKPIITPRFVPSCTSKLMEALGEMAKDKNLPVQSHLCENILEINWVKSMHPTAKSYGHVYDEYNLFGTTPTIMAHCIHLCEDEINRIKRNNVFIAHCPNSNINLSSGAARINKLMEEGIDIGLGSDISAGESVNMFKTMASSIKLSKVREFAYGDGSRALKSSEVFYLATKGGGKFFGRVGSFENGYEFDALVIDDNNLWEFYKGSLEERIEKLIYLGSKENIVARYCCGKEI